MEEYEHEVKLGGSEEEEQPQEGESKDEGEEKPAEEPKEESKEDDSKSDDSSSEDEGEDTPQTSDDEQKYEPPGPNAPGQTNKNPRKGPGEQQKGGRKPTEKKGEKDVRCPMLAVTAPARQPILIQTSTGAKELFRSHKPPHERVGEESQRGRSNGDGEDSRNRGSKDSLIEAG